MVAPNTLFRIIDLAAFSGRPAGSELAEISTSGSGSFQIPIAVLAQGRVANVVSAGGTVNVGATDYGAVLVTTSSAVTINLPDSTTRAGVPITVVAQQSGTPNITIVPSAGQLIVGQSDFMISQAFGGVTLWPLSTGGWYQNDNIGESSGPTEYYVNNSGNDNNSGKSSADPWATIAKVNAHTFQPGDSILFAGGQTFSGAIVSPSAGTPSAPITFGSYGTGRATINSGALGGFYSESQSGIIVRDLIFVGNGSGAVNGVWFNNILAGNVHCKNVKAINLDVSGYGWSGVIADGNNGSAGYDDVVIRGCVTHGNCTVVQGLTTRGTTGIGVFSNTGYGLANNAPSHNNVIIENCISHDNIGILDSQWTGSGIVIAETNQGIIRGCTAYNNQCPIGIWTYDSTNIDISYCVSHHNTSPTLGDGGGFDLDLGTSDCTISNCLSHDNFGEGFLLESGTFPGTSTTNNLSVINCVSVNDGGGTGSEDSCAFELVADNPTTTNITFSGCRAFNSTPNTKSFLMWGSQIAAVTGIVFDCEFICDGTSGQLFISTVNPLTSVATTPNSSNFFFRGNRYVGAVPIKWGGVTYASVNEWAVARAQEDQQQAPQITAASPLYTRTGTSLDAEVGFQNTQTHGHVWFLGTGINSTWDTFGLYDSTEDRIDWVTNFDNTGSFQLRKGASFSWSNDTSYAASAGETYLTEVAGGLKLGTSAGATDLEFTTRAFRAASTTLASLGAAGNTGTIACISDGDSGLAWGATAINSGAGATKYIVFDNGTNWTVMGK